MSSFLKASSQQLSSFENNFNEFIFHNSSFSTLHSNRFASQFSWNFNHNFDSRKRKLQEASSKIFSDFLSLKLKEENEYVE